VLIEQDKKQKRGNASMNIGILALQGAFIEHEKLLDKLGVEYTELRRKSDLDTKLDGIILPGGESTVQGKLLRELDMFDNIKEQIEDGLPVLATCAGMILLAKDIEDDATKHLATLPITVKRNAYGRQLGSFYTESDYKGLGEIPMTFIRAPYVAEAKPEVDVTAVVNDNIVGVEYKNQIAISFHPELDESTKIHERFLKMCH